MTAAHAPRRLDRRTLNRTLLDRQLLAGPSALGLDAAVAHLVGLQAQIPTSPYIGLWSRLARFAHADLADAISERRLVRIALMRSTIHLVTARDCRKLRPAVRQALDRELTATIWGPPIKGMDLDALLTEARAALRERPMTAAELGKHLLLRWPDRDPRAMAYAVRNLETLVQVPPRGLWGMPGQPRHAVAADWLAGQGATGSGMAGSGMAGTGMAGTDAADAAPGSDAAARRRAMIPRYLAAFGPATVMDVQAWAGVTRLAEVIEPLRPGLRTYRDENGRELWDLPEASLGDPDAPAPVRFLPEYDNAILGYADRSRIIPDGHTFASYARRLRPRCVVRGGVLADGFLAGVWSVTKAGDEHSLTVDPFTPLPPATAAAVEETGHRLLAFVGG
jgi:hypothetical protein